MPERKSTIIEQEIPTNSLRRSTRLHPRNPTGVQSPKTPNLAETRHCRPDSFSTPVSKIKNRRGRESELDSKNSRNAIRKSERLQRRTNFSRPDLGNQSVKGAAKSGGGSRRSGNRDEGSIAGKSKEVVYLREEEVVVRMVTRSSVRRNKAVYVGDFDSEEDCVDSVSIVSKERKNKDRVVHREEKAVKTEKRVTRRSCKTDVKTATRRKAVVPDEADPEEDEDLAKRDRSRKDVEDCGVVKMNGEQNFVRKAQVGEKRKRDGVEGGCENAQGWTKEQEVSLQRAYFTAKPTPLFWKKVARMVPGKSAEECFDRIHSDHQTPPQPRTRSRAKLKEPSPLSFSASKLLSPVERKTKRLGSKRRTLLAQKTVRKILQNQQKEDQDYCADLFSVLEPTADPSPSNLQADTTFASPEPSKASSFLTACRPVSSSSPKKHRSRLNGFQKAGFVSPPVLKQIKNKALHEKYIDQLHCRDAKRKAEALRNSRNIKGQIDEKANCLNQHFVKAAKDALVSDAQDAISKFRNLHNTTDDDGGGDDDDDDRGYDEDEYGNR
ncbi:uncharacterized protein LOC125187571 [Salvia hispanica]|uniref:uncharacterized protein LOC125187571 n=1 Tax=Salvia hispanica TaxID=49212 RepID=UPI002009AB2C|nr:uncharacterized protein LOC125187571 [Salvia hispanica]